MCYVADILFDNRSFVKILRYIVTGCSDNLDASLIRLPVGIATGERRKKRVVNIDDSVGVAFDKPRRENLHVACQSDCIDLLVLQ